MKRLLDAALAIGVFASIGACASSDDANGVGGGPQGSDGDVAIHASSPARRWRHDAGASDAATHDAGSAPDANASDSSAHDASSPDASSPDASSPDSGGTSGGGLFTQPQPWTTRVDGIAKSTQSDTIIQALAAAGGWGTGSFQMDMSIEVLSADSQTPMRAFTPTSDFYSPDCDNVPFPVPPGGALEGETGYACTQDGDCHLLVVHGPSQKLYEMWRANITGGTFYGGCTAVWDLTKVYPAKLRGDGCTSADAGGFPITAMLATADEVAAGDVPHALRFILPNARIRHDTYVHPGSHTTSATSGGTNMPPYGVRFRLRADYPLSSLPNQAARTLAIALQRYGMFLADGGNVPLTVRSDRSTQHTWASLGIDARSLGAITASDFEVVNLGATYSINDCTRNP